MTFPERDSASTSDSIVLPSRDLKLRSKKGAVAGSTWPSTARVMPPVTVPDVLSSPPSSGFELDV